MVGGEGYKRTANSFQLRTQPMTMTLPNVKAGALFFDISARQKKQRASSKVRQVRPNEAVLNVTRSHCRNIIQYKQHGPLNISYYSVVVILLINTTQSNISIQKKLKYSIIREIGLE